MERLISPRHSFFCVHACSLCVCMCVRVIYIVHNMPSVQDETIRNEKMA